MHRSPDIKHWFLSPKKKLFILIDQEKEGNVDIIRYKLDQIEKGSYSGVFLGGSTLDKDYSSSLFQETKSLLTKPIIGFPGSHKQIYPELDAVLFTSLISSRNPHFLIEEQVKGAPLIKKWKLPTIACGYVVIQTGKPTSVEQITNSTGIPSSETNLIIDTCLAAQYLGMECIYLEAGSGAAGSIPAEIIKQVINSVEIPIIVGGGIKHPNAVKKYWSLGVMAVVIGTAVENQPHILEEINQKI